MALGTISQTQGFKGYVCRARKQREGGETLEQHLSSAGQNNRKTLGTILQIQLSSAASAGHVSSGREGRRWSST